MALMSAARVRFFPAACRAWTKVKPSAMPYWLLNPKVGSRVGPPIVGGAPLR